MTAPFGLRTILGQNESRASLHILRFLLLFGTGVFPFGVMKVHDSSSISIVVLSTTLGSDLKLEVSVRING